MAVLKSKYDSLLPYTNETMINFIVSISKTTKTIYDVMQR